MPNPGHKSTKPTEVQSLLSVPWIADKEEFDEVMEWYGQAQQGYSIKHVAGLHECSTDEVERKLDRLYFAAVPLFLEAVKSARLNATAFKPSA